MFGTILKKYQKFKKDHIEEEEHISGLIKEEIEYITKTYLQRHNHKVIGIHKTQQLIEQKNKAIIAKNIVVNEVTTKWGDLYNKLNRALKEAGDLYNYSEFIERELGIEVEGKEESKEQVSHKEKVVFKYEQPILSLDSQTNQENLNQKQQKHVDNQPQPHTDDIEERI